MLLYRPDSFSWGIGAQTGPAEVLRSIRKLLMRANILIKSGKNGPPKNKLPPGTTLFDHSCLLVGTKLKLLPSKRKPVRILGLRLISWHHG